MAITNRELMDELSSTLRNMGEPTSPTTRATESVVFLGLAVDLVAATLRPLVFNSGGATRHAAVDTLVLLDSISESLALAHQLLERLH